MTVPSDVPLRAALVDLAVESWQFMSAVAQLAPSLDAMEQRRIVSRVGFFERCIRTAVERGGLTLATCDGQPFGPEIPVEAINGDDFEPNVPLVVDRTIAPIVLGPDGVLRTGRVTVRRLVTA